MTTVLEWKQRDDQLPPEGYRILAYSPAYEENHPMRFRILDSQFFRISTEATHWAFIPGPE